MGSDLLASLEDHITSGERLAIVKAPPGSGKTYLLLQLASHAVQHGRRVAIAAQTNAQADDICRRLSAEHPDVPTVRFASNTTQPQALGRAVIWATVSADLPRGPSAVVGTVAKWGLVNLVSPFDLLMIDEAWQMAWANFMLTGQVSERFILIGDPGQIPPVVSIPVQRWETSPRAPHISAPELILADPDLAPPERSIDVCRRLPHDAVDLVRPFYDFGFEPVAAPGERYVKVNGGGGHADRLDPALTALGERSASVVTLPTDPEGPPFDVDPELAILAASVVHRLLDRGATVADGKEVAQVSPRDIGVVATHRTMNSTIQDCLGTLRSEVRVETAERWQGLERKLMVVVHPLSGVAAPTGFSLDTGRLCVMASRHRAAMVVLSRDHIEQTLNSYIPSAEQAPGRPDSVGRGHAHHLEFWQRLTTKQSVLALSA